MIQDRCVDVILSTRPAGDHGGYLFGLGLFENIQESFFGQVVVVSFVCVCYSDLPQVHSLEYLTQRRAGDVTRFTILFFNFRQSLSTYTHLSYSRIASRCDFHLAERPSILAL